MNPATSPETDATRSSPPAQDWVPLALMLTMAAWGLNMSMVKAMTPWFDASLIASLRMVVASTAFGLLLWWRAPAWPRFNRRQWMALALCAFFMVYLNQILFAAGMKRTSAANAALIMATAPMISGLLAALSFGERLHLRHGAAVVLGFGGVAVVVLHKPGAALVASGLGDLLVLGCVLAFAVGGVLVQRLSPRIDALVLSNVIYLAGTAMLLIHLLLDQGQALSWARLFPGWWPWLLVVASGVTATALGNWVWNDAIARIGVARAALFVYWVPMFGMGFAALLLGEPLNAWYGLGLVMVLGGSWMASRRAIT